MLSTLLYHVWTNTWCKVVTIFKVSSQIPHHWFQNEFSLIDTTDALSLSPLLWWGYWILNNKHLGTKLKIEYISTPLRMKMFMWHQNRYVTCNLSFSSLVHHLWWRIYKWYKCWHVSCPNMSMHITLVCSTVGAVWALERSLPSVGADVAGEVHGGSEGAPTQPTWRLTPAPPSLEGRRDRPSLSQTTFLSSTFTSLLPKHPLLLSLLVNFLYS